MKTLTENRISKIPGFTRASEHDFSDDGNRFIGFEYKGLPLSQCRNSCGTFLAFRIDYLSEDTKLKFIGTWEDYSKQPWYPLCNKYNGVDELPEMDEIVKDLETVVTGIKELEKKLEATPVDTDMILKRLNSELALAQHAYSHYKSNIDLFSEGLNDYDVDDARRYIKAIKGDFDKINSTIHNIENKTLSVSRLRELEVSAKHDYIYIQDNNDFYISSLKKILEKQQKYESKEA